MTKASGKPPRRPAAAESAVPSQTDAAKAPAPKRPARSRASTTTTASPAIDELAVYRSLFAAYPDGLLLVDSDGRIVLANPSACELFDYDADTLLGLSVDDLVPTPMRSRHVAYRAAYGKAPTTRPMGARMELRARRRDGSEVTVEISLSPLHAARPKGAPGFVVAAIRAVDAYPRVKQALQRARFAESVALLGRHAVNARTPQALLDEVPAAVAATLEVDHAAIIVHETDRSQLRVLASHGWREVPQAMACEHLADTLVGHVMAADRPVRIADLSQEKDIPLAPAALLRGCASLIAVPLADRGRPAGALLVACASPRSFSDEDVQFLDSVGSIVTTSLQRVRTEEALSHSQKLESVGQLTGGIAHDFNNLLTVISGNLQVVQEMPAYIDDPSSQPLVDAAIRATRRGAELTGKLLAFARRQRLQPTTVEIPELLASLTGMLRRTLDPRIDIRLDAQRCACLVDAGQLESALLNIALNARDAMPEGGTLSFRCRGGIAMPEELLVDGAGPSTVASAQVMKNRRYVEIAVTDTGTGMTEDIRERAFEPFFTTKAQGRGTGLGLSTVYGFARQSDGTAAIISRVGVGTTVTLYLPEATQASKPRASSSRETGLPAGMPVLLVEDDPDVRRATHQLLIAMGCTVDECPTAEIALQRLAEANRFRLLLTDIELGPGISGLELARQMRESQPELAIVVMSGFPDQTPGGASDWSVLRKPFTRAELARAMLDSLG